MGSRLDTFANIIDISIDEAEVDAVVKGILKAIDEPVNFPQNDSDDYRKKGGLEAYIREVVYKDDHQDYGISNLELHEMIRNKVLDFKLQKLSTMSKVEGYYDLEKTHRLTGVKMVMVALEQEILKGFHRTKSAPTRMLRRINITL